MVRFFKKIVCLILIFLSVVHKCPKCQQVLGISFYKERFGLGSTSTQPIIEGEVGDGGGGGDDDGDEEMSPPMTPSSTDSSDSSIMNNENEIENPVNQSI